MTKKLPNEQPNMNLFSPIWPLFKPPSPQKTAPFMLVDLTPTPEAVLDKLLSPVKDPSIGTASLHQV